MSLSGAFFFANFFGGEKMAGSGRNLEIKGITKIFRTDGNNFAALRKTDLLIEDGKFVCLIGPSGCGKSTLFNIIAGLLQPSTGDILLGGESILGKKGRVGYMLQKDMLLPWRTILDNIILGMEVKHIPRNDAVQKALPLMAKYGLKGFEKHYPGELSGGMRQRAALLRTILYDSDIILLDEPFGALDAQTRIKMQNWLLQIWRDFKKTVLFVTHDIDEAIYLADQILVFSPRPGYVREIIDVNMDRPRQTSDMMTENYQNLKKHLLDLLAVSSPVLRQPEKVEE